MKKTSHKHQIGDIITDIHSGKLQILEQIRMGKNNKKGYKYKCLICGNEDTISEGNLISNHRGCNVCCTPCRKVLKGYNDMWTTNPELAKLLANPEDGYKYTQGSDEYVDWKCSNCGNIIKHKQIKVVKSSMLSCPKCGDGISYPEKFVYSFLQQLLGDNFTYQLTKTNFNWIDNYKYDFYFKINNEEYFLEVNGLQHYSDISNFNYCGGRTLKEEKENDENKKELALQNGIKSENYIILDCSKSTLEWIKDHILKSRLNELFDLSKIDWMECNKYACSSLVRQICDLWTNGVHSTIEIGKIMKLNRHTINKHLKQGIKLNWCDYNPKEVMKKINSKIGKSKKIICLNNNKVFHSIGDAINFYNIKGHHIGDCCKNKRSYCGKDSITSEYLQWQYYDEYLIKPKKLLSNDKIMEK